MNETDTIQYAPIREYNFKEYFQKFQYNGQEISDSERKEFIKGLDDTIAEYSEGFPTLKEGLDIYKDREEIFFKAYRTIESVYQFVVITFVDCLVICKYFLLADKDYDKRFMRGKMKVILNEGFKKLYGFNELSQKKSEWRRLITAVDLCPEKIKRQYKELSERLEEHSKSSSWWKDERVLETHLIAEGLYDSRCEDIVESKVMIDAAKLLSTLYAIQLFTTNVHACFLNTILKYYKDQEARNA